MLFSKSFKWVVTFILFIVALMYYGKYENYEKEYGSRDMTGIVYEKVNSGETRYRSNEITIKYVLIVKDDITGKYLDFKVNPTTYATHKVGDKIKFFNVSKERLGEEYEWKPYHLLSVLFGIGCGIMLIYSFCSFLDD